MKQLLDAAFDAVFLQGYLNGEGSLPEPSKGTLDRLVKSLRDMLDAELRAPQDHEITITGTTTMTEIVGKHAKKMIFKGAPGIVHHADSLKMPPLEIDEEAFLGKSRVAAPEHKEAQCNLNEQLTMKVQGMPLAKKPRKQMSDESKANLRASLEKARAARAAKRKDESKPPPAQTEMTVRVDTPADRIIEKHADEYIGEREPGQPLTDEDWPDIQRLMSKGGSKGAIVGYAKQYGVPFKVFEDFIGKHILAEARASDERRKKRMGV